MTGGGGGLRDRSRNLTRGVLFINDFRSIGTSRGMGGLYLQNTYRKVNFVHSGRHWLTSSLVRNTMQSCHIHIQLLLGDSQPQDFLHMVNKDTLGIAQYQ